MTELQFIEVAYLLALLFVFSAFSYFKKSLDLEGILLGNIIGILVFLWGGLQSFYVIVIFFITAELSTRVGRQKIGIPHERRTTGNILGNSMAGVIMLALQSPLGFYTAMSAALADTLSSEIGLTSSQKPRLITNWKEVEPGTDGGVTVRGILAAVLGGLIIGAVYYYWNGNGLASILIVIAGVIGSLTDSVLGAIFERKKTFLDNTSVNFLGSMSGGMIGWIAALTILK